MNTVTLNPTLYSEASRYALSHHVSLEDLVERCLKAVLFKKIVKSPLRKRLETKLQSIRALNENWDHNDAPKISISVCDVASGVLEKCCDEQLNGLAIFPNINGNIFMQWRTAKGRACLGISDEKLFYDVVFSEGKIVNTTTVEEISVFMRDLKNIY